MSIERSILQRLNESRRLDEAWPPILNKLPPHDKARVRACLNKLGIDIENTPYNVVTITNGRDPRLKDNNVCIFEFSSNSNRTYANIGVWCNNKFVVDVYDFHAGKNVSKMSWKDILANATRITSIEFNKDISQTMKNKQANRAESQEGSVNRFNPKDKNKKGFPKYPKLDKSGYVLDPNKYKRMLADLKINNGDKVLKDAKDIYVKLANIMDKVYQDSGSGIGTDFDNYDNVMRGITTTFARLSKSLAEYNSYKSKESGERRDWWEDTLKDEVSRNIQIMLEYIKQGKKFL